VLFHLLVLDNNPAGPIGPLSGPHLWANHQRRRLRYRGTLSGCVADQTGRASSTFKGVLGSGPGWPQIQHQDKGDILFSSQKPEKGRENGSEYSIFKAIFVSVG
jgi:hypothetical protein